MIFRNHSISRLVFVLISILATHAPVHGIETGPDTGSRINRLLEILHYKGQGSSPLQTSDETGTCGLGLRFEIDRRWHEFTPAQQRELQSLLSRPFLETTRILGHFRIHYDTSASSSALPALIWIDDKNIAHRISGTAEAFVDSVGRYFNAVWDYEVDTLGYDPPPADTDGYFHIFIVNFSNTGIYGETTWDGNPLNTGQPPRFATYIMIDKDFTTFYPPTRGIPALKVTAAHEFQHAIHLGAYGYWPDDLYYYELTATWMEQVVFHDVKDYIQYFYQGIAGQSLVGGHFTAPDVSFTSVAGMIEFSRCLWGCYLQKRYSPDVIRRTWEYMRTERSIQASDDALHEYGSSLRQAFLEWTVWNLHTGPDADTVNYYPDGKLYPVIAKRSDIAFSGTPRSFVDSIQAMSSSYHPVCLLDALHPSCNSGTKLVAAISNLDAGASGEGVTYGFRYDIAPSGGEGFKPLGDGIYVRVTASNPAMWASQEIIVDSGAAPILLTPHYAEPLVCPNPFYPKGSTPLSFSLPDTMPTPDNANLSIYGVSMDRIFSNALPIGQTPCGTGIRWNGLAQNGSPVPSGIYFYVITYHGNRYTGKFAIIQE